MNYVIGNEVEIILEPFNLFVSFSVCFWKMFLYGFHLTNMNCFQASVAGTIDLFETT